MLRTIDSSCMNCLSRLPCRGRLHCADFDVGLDVGRDHDPYGDYGQTQYSEKNSSCHDVTSLSPVARRVSPTASDDPCFRRGFLRPTLQSCSMLLRPRLALAATAHAAFKFVAEVFWFGPDHKDVGSDGTERGGEVEDAQRVHPVRVHVHSCAAWIAKSGEIRFEDEERARRLFAGQCVDEDDGVPRVEERVREVEASVIRGLGRS
jgi:hypothetical protein